MSLPSTRGSRSNKTYWTPRTRGWSPLTIQQPKDPALQPFTTWESDEGKLREIAANWGTRTPEERSKIVQEITRGLPPKQLKVIEEYFQALDKTHKPRADAPAPPKK